MRLVLDMRLNLNLDIGLICLDLELARRFISCLDLVRALNPSLFLCLDQHLGVKMKHKRIRIGSLSGLEDKIVSWTGNISCASSGSGAWSMNGFWTGTWSWFWSKTGNNSEFDSDSGSYTKKI